LFDSKLPLTIAGLRSMDDQIEESISNERMIELLRWSRPIAANSLLGP
jgi:hypothetical protein